MKYAVNVDGGELNEFYRAVTIDSVLEYGMPDDTWNRDLDDDTLDYWMKEFSEAVHLVPDTCILLAWGTLD